MTVNKLHVLAFAVATLSNPAQAYTGFYLGGNLGGNWLRGNHNLTINGGTPDAKRISKISFIGGVHIGYTTEISDKIIIGAEVAGLIITGGQKSILNNGPANIGTVEIKHKRSINAGVILGKLLNPRVLIYTKFGADFGNFEVRYQQTSLFPVSSKKYNKIAIMPALGMKYAFNAHFMVGGEYQYLGTYAKLVPLNTTVGGNSFYASYKPAAHRLTLSMSYMF